MLEKLDIFKSRPGIDQGSSRVQAGFRQDVCACFLGAIPLGEGLEYHRATLAGDVLNVGIEFAFHRN